MVLYHIDYKSKAFAKIPVLSRVDEQLRLNKCCKNASSRESRIRKNASFIIKCP